MLFSNLAGCLLFLSFIVAYPILEREPLGVELAARGRHTTPAHHSTPHRAARTPVHKPVRHRAPIHKPPPHNPPHKPSSRKSTPARRPGTSPRPHLILYKGGGYVENARKANLARKECKEVTDCSCPKHPNTQIHSTSCINGFCSCDNPAINFITGEFLNAVKAIGNAPITKAIGNLMQGLADAKEVLGTIVGAFLGPEAKAALKVALLAFPDTGPSHIDQATKGLLTSVL